MKMLRALVLPIVVLALTPGCEPKKGGETTTPPDSAGSQDESGDAGGGDESGADGSGGDEAGGDSGGDAAPAGDGGVTECDAEVADTPTALWADRVLVRMPKGVEMVERNEVFAQASGEAQSTCDVMVSRAAMGYFQDDTAKGVKQLRDDTLTQIGFDMSVVTWSDETENGRNFTGAYEAPEDDKGNPPVKGWFVFKESQGTLFWMIMETHPNAYPAIKKSFKKSGSSLLIVPQG